MHSNDEFSFKRPLCLSKSISSHLFKLLWWSSECMSWSKSWSSSTKFPINPDINSFLSESESGRQSLSVKTQLEHSFEPGGLSYCLSYTEFRVLTSLESIKSVITCILFLRAINIPTEYSLPQQDRGFYLLDHSMTLLAVNRKLACSFYSSAVSTTGFVVGPYFLSKRTLEQFGGRA